MSLRAFAASISAPAAADEAFQARVMNKSGYSDWSDSVTLMCI